jgi:hypothetical protein
VPGQINTIGSQNCAYLSTSNSAHGFSSAETVYSRTCVLGFGQIWDSKTSSKKWEQLLSGNDETTLELARLMRASEAKGNVPAWPVGDNFLGGPDMMRP